MTGPTRLELRELIARQLPRCRPETWDALAGSARLSNVKRGEKIYALGRAVPITLILIGFGVARRPTATGLLLTSGVASAGALFGWSGRASANASLAMVS